MMQDFHDYFKFCVKQKFYGVPHRELIKILHKALVAKFPFVLIDYLGFNPLKNSIELSITCPNGDKQSFIALLKET